MEESGAKRNVFSGSTRETPKFEVRDMEFAPLGKHEVLGEEHGLWYLWNGCSYLSWRGRFQQM